MIRILFYLILILLLLTLIGGIFFTNFDYDNIHRIDTKITLSNQILQELKAIGELHTAITSVQTVITGEQNRTILNAFSMGHNQILLIVVGHTRAGIDFSKIETEHIREENNHIRIRLPPVEILDSKVDLELTKIYDVRESKFFSPPTAHLHQEMLRYAEKKTTETSIELGILDLAENNAITLLQSIFSGLDLSISFEVAANHDE